MRDALLAELVGLDAPASGGGFLTLCGFVGRWRLVSCGVSKYVRGRRAESVCRRACWLR